ncbi:DUF5667 domain-containing protein [Chloroflexota bacterium]
MMKESREFDNILDECLERILAKGETIEECLARYPEEAAELEPLLQTILVTKEAVVIKPRPEFRERARYQFHATLREMEEKRERRFSLFSWQPQWVTAVIVVLVLLLASSGTVAAANNSMPDEPLYPVKLATEAVRVRLTPSTLGKAELYANLADKRVAEIVRMAEKGKPEQVVRVAERLNTHFIAMASLAVPPKEAEALLAPVPQEAPTPSVEKESQEKDAGMFMAPAPPKEVQKASGPPGAAREGRGVGGGGGDDKGVKVSNRVALRMILARRAVEHPETLRAALERVPESVKPALRRAIAVADIGYEEALKALD